MKPGYATIGRIGSGSAGGRGAAAGTGTVVQVVQGNNRPSSALGSALPRSVQQGMYVQYASIQCSM